MNAILTKGNTKKAEKLEKAADGLNARIKDRLRPMSQAYTPKRAREAEQRNKEGMRLQRIQNALRGLAAMHRADSIPYAVENVTTRPVVEYLLQWNTYPDNMDARWQDKPREELTKAGCGADLFAEAKAVIMELAQDDPATLKLKHEREMAVKVKEMIGQVPGFFPTPKPVIDIMLEPYRGRTFKRILEPEAGDGAIARELRSTFPDAKLEVIEYNYTLQGWLKDQGFNLVGGNFMETGNATGVYDFIAANPPFEGMADADHVMEMYRYLCPGGELVSVMSPSPFFNGKSKGENFRKWFEKVNGEKEELPAGSFKDSLTNTSSVLVRIRKAG